MKKIEFLQDIFSRVGGTINPGYRNLYDLQLGGYGFEAWVDYLPGGKISIKVKYFRSEALAEKVADVFRKKLSNSPYNIEISICGVQRYYYFVGYGIKLVCDKYWK